MRKKDWATFDWETSLFGFVEEEEFSPLGASMVSVYSVVMTLLSVHSICMSLTQPWRGRRVWPHGLVGSSIFLSRILWRAKKWASLTRKVCDSIQGFFFPSFTSSSWHLRRLNDMVTDFLISAWVNHLLHYVGTRLDTRGLLY